ncbi:uncharacterized protein LOC110111780 [Dendrobium catenatum]|uniref:DUF4220 domain-containing protein n=1 Tax=Dendrobium catenatum TaxID=906689 RepID=A0A2I0WUY5_9ASPA|nr:uncharacterized protein LOC110111780 [Dendrobium catenatum]PKU79472.1 hypothetical protein MA16_Dca000818 [Dendrobium catenatum]
MEIPLKYKQLWNNWDVRVLILLSLSIQIILIFLGRLRRTSTSRWIRMVVWVSYILADWVASFALGNLSSNMDDSSSSNVVIAFWAPFLILHLGGPDTITAYSMEDNELWARHLLGLGYELFIAFYVLFRSLPDTRLLMPTLLIFLVGIIKYVERSYSLYKASVEGIQSSINPLSPTKLERTNDLNALSQDFWLYYAAKPSFIDVAPYSDKYLIIKTIFMNISAEEVLMVIRKELSNAYDEFYTKSIVNHSILGYVLRVLCSTCILLAFSLFILEPKNDFNKLDVAITYVLLATSICLDFMATVMLMFSDRMIVYLLNVKKLSKWSVLLAKFFVRIKKACPKRKYWSIKLPQLNLLSNCLSISSPNKTLQHRMMSWVAKRLRFVQEIKLNITPLIGESIKLETFTLHTIQPVQATQDVLELIVSHLKSRIHLDLFDFNEPAGSSSLRQVTTIRNWAVEPFVQLFEKFSLEKQVLIWHITTDLCFYWNSESQHLLEPHQTKMEVEKNRLKGVKRTSTKMETCKYLSNYMMHTVMIRSYMMSNMGGESHILAGKVIKDMVEFIHKSYDGHHLQMPNEIVEACMKMKETPIEFGNLITSLFGTARVLAHLMLVISEEERWQVITTAWVELLQKVAMSSKGNIHMKQLSIGDDLLTFVWLLNKNINANILDEPVAAIYGVYDKIWDFLSEIKSHLNL